MLIDCDTCVGQGVHCGDCVISVLLATSPRQDGQVDLSADESVALVSLAAAGLVPPLRLVHDGAGRDTRGIA